MTFRILTEHPWIKRGWPEPIIADSGNGASLLYKTNIQNTPENTELIKKCIETFHFLYTDDKTEIDLTVFNPARIVKLYGTIAKKGDNTADRPHRKSKILEIPVEIKEIPIETIKTFTGILPAEPEIDKSGVHEKFDIEAWLKQHDISVKTKKGWNGGMVYNLEQCPFDSNHKFPDSSVIVMKSGAIVFHCFHNSCANHDWKSLRNMKEPTRKPPTMNAKKQTPTTKNSSLINGAFGYIDRIT